MSKIKKNTTEAQNLKESHAPCSQVDAMVRQIKHYLYLQKRFFFNIFFYYGILCLMIIVFSRDGIKSLTELWAHGACISSLTFGILVTKYIFKLDFLEYSKKRKCKTD